MGGHCSDYSYRPEPKQDILEKECGIIACAELCGREVDTFVQNMKAENGSLYNRLWAKVNNGSGYNCLDLKEIINSQYSSSLNRVLGISSSPYQDCRFCSQKRSETDYFPLPEDVTGIIAMKFINSNDTHWAAFKRGNVITADRVYQSISEIREDFPGFDGFGHRFVLWDEQQYDLIRRTYSVRCKGVHNEDICEVCCRKEFCFEKCASQQEPYDFGECSIAKESCTNILRSIDV